MKRYRSFPGTWESENLDKDKFLKIWKKCKFCQQIAKILDVKMLKTILLPLETMQ